MTNGDFINMVVNDLKAYHKGGVLESVKHNSHMSKYAGERVSPDTIDAILVDFVNFIGSRRGMDLGLYTKDLREEKP